MMEPMGTSIIRFQLLYIPFSEGKEVRRKPLDGGMLNPSYAQYERKNSSVQLFFNKDFAMDPPLSIIGENGKEGMEGGTEKEGNPRSLMYLERGIDPSKPRAHLK